MRYLDRILIAINLFFLLSSTADAQTNPGLVDGAILCANTSACTGRSANPSGLNQILSNKADYPINPSSVPGVKGVVFSGTPSAGYVPVASGSAAATWTQCVNIGISSCGATIPASLACGVPCLDLGGGLVLNLAQQSYYAMGPFAGIAFFSATNPAMTVAPAWAFSLNGSGAEALIYSNNNFDSIQATAFSTTSTLWTFGIGVQFDVNPIVATSGAGAAITINGPSGYSAQNLLQVNGSTLGAMYVDASQTIMGSVTANPLKLIYNNSAVLTMTNISMNVPGLPTSAGSGGLYICVDTSGNFYKKSSCP